MDINEAREKLPGNKVHFIDNLNNHITIKKVEDILSRTEHKGPGARGLLYIVVGRLEDKQQDSIVDGKSLWFYVYPETEIFIKIAGDTSICSGHTINRRVFTEEPVKC